MLQSGVVYQKMPLILPKMLVLGKYASPCTNLTLCDLCLHSVIHFFCNCLSGYTLNKSPVHRRADTQRRTFMLTFPPMGSLESPINLHVFVLWKEAGVPGENQRRHGENMQTPTRKVLHQLGINPKTLLMFFEPRTLLL